MHPLVESLKIIISNLRSEDKNEDYIRLVIKEELQNYILDAIYKDTGFDSLIFIGGTCLRKIYKLNRLSEDLDFDDLEDKNLNELGKYIVKYFQNIKFDNVEYSVQKNDSVNRLIVKFEILSLLGLSGYLNEKLHIKVETTNPQVKYHFIMSPFAHDHLSIMIKHYDLPILMSGKIGACLQRVWYKGDQKILVKGRDYYDLIWYMQKGILPDESRLKDIFSNKSIKEIWESLDEKVEKIRSEDLYIDLQSFFPNQKYIREWCDNFHTVYRSFRHAPLGEI